MRRPRAPRPVAGRPSATPTASRRGRSARPSPSAPAAAARRAHAAVSALIAAAAPSTAAAFARRPSSITVAPAGPQRSPPPSPRSATSSARGSRAALARPRRTTGSCTAGDRSASHHRAGAAECHARAAVVHSGDTAPAGTSPDRGAAARAPPDRGHRTRSRCPPSRSTGSRARGTQAPAVGLGCGMVSPALCLSLLRVSARTHRFLQFLAQAPPSLCNLGKQPHSYFSR